MRRSIGSAGSRTISRKGLAARMACMALLLGLVGLLLRPVPAQAITNYDVWVGGVQVTSYNMDNVLGDGTVTFRPGTSSETPGTLTLTNAHITPANVSYKGDTYYAGILLGSNANCSITLEEANTIGSTSSPAHFGILSDGYLQIHHQTGGSSLADDTLDIYAGGGSYENVSRGILCMENTVIDAGLFLNIHCYGEYCNGIEAQSSYGVNNSGYLTIDMDNGFRTTGVFVNAYDGVFVISGIGRATISGGNCAVQSDNVNVGGYQTSDSAELTCRSYFVLLRATNSVTHAHLDFSNLSAGYAEASPNSDGSNPVAYVESDQNQYQYLHVLSLETYDIWFGNIQVTDNNRADILGDGTAWFEPGAGPNPDTLYLKNCDFFTEGDGSTSGPGAYKVGEDSEGPHYAGLYIVQPLRIVVSGYNGIHNNKGQAAESYGMVIFGDLEIVGNGSGDYLDVNGADCRNLDSPIVGGSYGGFVYGNLTVSSCSAVFTGNNAGSESLGLYCLGKVTAADSAHLNTCGWATNSSPSEDHPWGSTGAIIYGGLYIDGTSDYYCWADSAPNNRSVGLEFIGSVPESVLIEGDATILGSADADEGYGILVSPYFDNSGFVLAPAHYMEVYGVDQAFSMVPTFAAGYKPYVYYGTDYWDCVGKLNPASWVYTGNEYVSICPKGAAFRRIAGSNRYQTARDIVLVGFQQSSVTKVILATGESYPDALCASALAGKEGAPIVMTTSSSLSIAAAQALGNLQPEDIIVVGGTGAVSDATVESACDAAGITNPSAHVQRYYGANRYATCLDVYQSGGLGGDTCIVATGGNFADALSISPYAYATETPVFLADPKTLKLDATTEAAIKGDFDNVIIVGGTGVVSDDVVEQIGATSVVRLAGASRYDTSMEIAKWEMHLKSGLEVKFQPSMTLGVNNVSVAYGGNFPDALAGGALCGKYESVLLLVSESNYSQQVKLVKDNADDVGYGFIFGGTGAVSDKVKARFDAALN